MADMLLKHRLSIQKMREQSLLGEARGGALALPTDLKWAGVDDIERANIFNKDTMMYLRGLSEFVYHHQDVGYHIMHFIQQEAPRDPDEYSCVNKDQLKKDLSFLIFTDDFAEKAVECITDSSVCSRNALYWATDFLGNLMNRSYRYVQVPKCDLSTLKASCFESDFSDNWVPSDVIGDYKYSRAGAQDWCVDEFFSQQYQIQQQGRRGQQNTRNRSINIMNVERNVDHPFIETDPERYQYYFHGTNWGSVDNIMENGILPMPLSHRSRKTLDFSNDHNPGFYVATSLKAARDWANRDYRPAVIVFKVCKESMTGSRHLNTTGDRRILHQIFRHFRHGVVIENQELKDQLNQCVTITGPTLDPKTLEEDPQLSVVRSDITQTCFYIRKQMNDNVGGDIPSFLMSSIYCVLYYPEKLLRTVPREPRNGQ